MPPAAPQTVLACGKCKLWLASQFLATPGFVRCPSCGSEVQYEVFPALFRQPEASSAGEALMGDGEAACFHHPAKRAVVPCGACGRFLCSLCDIEIAGEHLCPACMQAGAKKGRIHKLQNERTLYDDIALAAAAGGLIVGCWPSIVTGPLAIYLSVKHWNSPGSIVPRGRWRFVVAIVLSVVGLLMVGFMLVAGVLAQLGR